MFIVEKYSLAILLCVITMLCRGSWANTTKFTSKTWRFKFFYWDYGFGILLTTLLLAFTLGSSGSEGGCFLADINQAGTNNMLSAFVGGIIFNLANILLVAAIAIALVLGVLVNYIAVLQGNLLLIFAGVALI